jgi:pimeloyl-ACP methyl ester carboxylesterase
VPHRAVNGTHLWVEDTGGDRPPVVFSHGLLWSARLFDPQVAALRGRYRCVSYDHRGQGLSAPAPGRGAVTIEQCYADLEALVDQLGAGPVHVVGLSMGGFVGMRLAARRPDLVRSLALLDTSADPEPAANRPRYRRLATAVRWLGVRPVADRVMPIMFGRTFLSDPARAADRALWRARLLENRRDVWRAVHGVIDRPGVIDELGRITAPTLVVVGDEDVATVPAKAARVAAAIPGARLTRVPGAGHSSTVEQPARVTALLAEFLAEVEASRAHARPGAAT